MDRDELADFLRRSRARLQPTDVGLPPGVRRRTPGLRREEVAQLAGMSLDYLVRLEQRRSTQPSAQILAALARALRLSDDERDHLFHLAGRDEPRSRTSSKHVGPALLRVLDELTHTAALVCSDLGEALAQNALSRLLHGDHLSETGPRRNHVWRWFAEPELVRVRYPAEDHALQSRSMVADLRATAARRAGAADVEELVGDLLARSPEFAALWADHDVAVRRSHRKRILHPVVGLIEVDGETVATEGGEQRLLIATAVSGQSAERLELLRVLGSQDLSPDDEVRLVGED